MVLSVNSNKQFLSKIVEVSTAGNHSENELEVKQFEARHIKFRR